MACKNSGAGEMWEGMFHVSPGNGYVLYPSILFNPWPVAVYCASRAINILILANPFNPLNPWSVPLPYML
jgi:hypothetical protein